MTAALDDLREALHAAGVEAVDADDSRADLYVDTGARRLPVRIKVLSLADVAAVTPLLAHAETSRRLNVIVADRVVEPARALLARPGWGYLDRRGRLALRGPGLVVDVPVPATIERPAPTPPLATGVGREVAVAFLLGEETETVRGLARRLLRSPSAVSTAFAGLRAEGLIDDAMKPVVPDLFWALAAQWRSPVVHLLRAPSSGTSRDKALDVDGWALTDTRAAMEYGAPVAVGSAYPPDFAVPDKWTLDRAKRLLGAADATAYGATVRVARVPWVCTRRVEHGDEWPLAHPLFVALDLAADPGRGREVLDAWTPPEPWRRVW
jgi:hypothetical protein